MFELAKEIGVKMLRIIPAVPCGTAKENHIWMSKKEYDIVRNYVREGRKKVSNMEIDCPIDQEIEKDREIFCRAGTLWVYVNFKGEVYPCNNIQDRESICWDKTIKEDKLTDIWRNSKLLNFMRDYNVKSINEECMECSYRVECVGECRALAWSRYRTYNLNMKPEVCFKDLNIEEFRGY
jgi:radical SAM protein with 4Fe4S-binding SPASM domain